MNVASKQEGNSVPSMLSDRAEEESWTSSRTAPEMEPAENCGRNASELIGGYKYDWNDPNLVKLFQNDTERGSSAKTPVTIHGNEESENPTALGDGYNLSDILGIKEMSPEEARGYGLGEFFPELRKDKEIKNDNSTQPRQPLPESGKSDTRGMEFLARLNLEDFKRLGFTSSDLEMATASAVENSEVAGTGIATLQHESLAARPAPSHAPGSRYKPHLQPGNDEPASTTDLQDAATPARKFIVEASRLSPPPPPPALYLADEGAHGNMSAPLDVRKMSCSKTLWPTSSNTPSGKQPCKTELPSANEQVPHREHTAPVTPASASNNDTPATSPAVDSTEANNSPDLTVQDLSDAIGTTLSPELRALLQKHIRFEADQNE